jgi:heme exporter protein B
MLAREAVVEWRTRSLLSSMALFAVLCVVVLGLGVRSLAVDETFHRFVLAMLWVCSLFAALVGLNRAAVSDLRRGFVHALLAAPHDAALAYTARLVTVLCLLLATQALMVLLAVPLLRFGLWDQPLLLLIVPLADIGVLAPGVLLASATGRVRGGEALLAILLLPVVVPVFAGAAFATDALAGGQGWRAALPFVLLLGICDATFAALGLLLFGRLNEA